MDTPVLKTIYRRCNWLYLRESLTKDQKKKLNEDVTLYFGPTGISNYSPKLYVPWVNNWLKINI